jgi:predicted nucleotidyltransferase
VQITSPDDDRQEMSSRYAKMNISEIDKRFKNFRWRYYLRSVFKNVKGVNVKTDLADDSELVVYGVEFFDALDLLWTQFPQR